MWTCRRARGRRQSCRRQSAAVLQRGTLKDMLIFNKDDKTEGDLRLRFTEDRAARARLSCARHGNSDLSKCLVRLLRNVLQSPLELRQCDATPALARDPGKNRVHVCR